MSGEEISTTQKKRKPYGGEVNTKGNKSNKRQIEERDEANSSGANSH